MDNRSRILWRSPHQLTESDLGALLLGVVPPSPSADEWESSIRKRWSDDAMTVLKPAREAELRQQYTTERLPDGALNIIWWPQPGPQQDLIECQLPEVFKGGARGGGKTDGVLAKWATKAAQYGQAFNAMMFRKTMVASEDAIARSKELYTPLGGVYSNGSWRMPGGGRIGFGYLDSVMDADAWQGRNLTDIWIEECGLYADPAVIWRLFATLRSAAGVPTQMILTGNPGGPGQHWVRERYDLVPFPRDARVLLRELPNGQTHKVAVIPSRIENNRILLNNDPRYISRLHLVGNPALVRAMLDGDWSAVEGAFFDCWSAKNITPPFKLPEHWLRFRSMDWGSYSPFSVGWWAVVTEEYTLPDKRVLPAGAIVRYREYYGSANSSSDKGLKLTAEQVAQGIIDREKSDLKLAYGALDPSTFKEDGGPSVAERINQKLIAAKLTPFKKADNTRVDAKRGPMSGWDAVAGRIIGLLNDKGEPKGVPMLYVFDTCKVLIRTLPTLQHDPARPEDVLKGPSDHACDETRYAVLSRPWVRADVIKAGFDVMADAYRSQTDQSYSDYVQSSVKLL
jgi:hypothetical protein